MADLAGVEAVAGVVTVEAGAEIAVMAAVAIHTIQVQHLIVFLILQELFFLTNSILIIFRSLLGGALIFIII